MIRRLVQSAFQTGWLSVESESLIRQVLAIKAYQQSDIEALDELYGAVRRGVVKREGRGNVPSEYAHIARNVSVLN
ncbi:hypothetical protein [Geitlerinema calcuttense]|uniref:Uncharacterized protein n=1 Tax=Geitlerinema calcuttense NRMC-F 0142 TaxID=2922238 RepID=A0ABT7LZR7_9CYAN|nr:hypothetical protein [Geitlerinema calcuttense]MDI9640534.1 hypothetical protein [Geitlerinema splendidum]MDL5057299.1 hypothetical protein [Geitlerinema calcuttense NRMC-F 0142]